MTENTWIPAVLLNIKDIACINNVYRCTPDTVILSSAQHCCFLEYSSDSVFPYFIIFVVLWLLILFYLGVLLQSKVFVSLVLSFLSGATVKGVQEGVRVSSSHGDVVSEC